MKIFLKEIDNTFDKDLLKVFENCRDYFELVEGEVPKNTDDFFLSLPPNKTVNDKINLGIFKDKNLIGAIDIIKNYPEEKEWIIGLMIIDINYRKSGFGEKAHELIKHLAKEKDAYKLRIGVAEQNILAKKFWEKLGYKIIKITEPMKIGNKESRIIVMNYIILKGGI